MLHRPTNANHVIQRVKALSVFWHSPVLVFLFLAPPDGVQLGAQPAEEDPFLLLATGLGQALFHETIFHSHEPARSEECLGHGEWSVYSRVGRCGVTVFGDV